MRRYLFLSLLATSVFSQLPCPSGRVAVLSTNNTYLDCNDSTERNVCGSNGTCEIVSNPLASKSQQICCIPSSLLCPDGQFMNRGRCSAEDDLPSMQRAKRQAAQLGGPCQSAQQCPANAICDQGTCKCPDVGFSVQNGQCVVSGGSSGGCPLGQVLVNNGCLPLAPPGTVCQSSLQCIDNSACINQRCACSNPAAQLMENYCVTTGQGCAQARASNGLCLPFVKTTFACQASEQCVGGSTCVNSVCTCPSGTTDMFNYCITPVNTCLTGQVLVNGQCVQHAAPNTPCQANAQCLESSTCSGSTCTCSAGTTLLAGHCVPPASAPCNNNQIQISGQCANLALPGSPCTFSQQCVSGAICINSLCSCPSGRTSMYGFCVVTGRDGVPGTGGTGGSCLVGQVLVNNVCLIQVQPGQQCQASQQCIGGGQCLNSICQSQNGNGNCPNGQVMVSGQCMNIVQQGGFCQFSQQCANNGQCLSSICQSGGSSGQCKIYQVSVSGQCYDTVSIGMQCTVQQQCINNANCVSNRCQCNAGLTFNGQACLSAGNVSPTCTGLTVSANGQCLQLAAMSQSCSATPQCMGFSVCISASCGCPFAYTQVNGVCRRTTSVTNCPDGQVMSASGACLSRVALGASCQINDQCPMGGSCALGTCVQGSSTSPTCSDPNKEVVLNNGQPINCQVQLCPSDAQCENAQQQFVCCRARNLNGGTPGVGTGYCPAGQTVELLSSGTPKNCLVQVCSAGRVCVYSAAASGSVCCGATAG